MENMRQIARAYYERSSEEEKRSVEAFFENLDADHDGKVSLVDLKEAVPWRSISNENVFRQLDKNGDGTLKFKEVLPVYYMVNKVKLMSCSGCKALLPGPYFSCRLCLGNPSGTFDLCCNCYRRREVDHEHPSSYMLDHHSLIDDLMKTRPKASGNVVDHKHPSSCTLGHHSLIDDLKKTRPKKEMEELRKISIAYYEASSTEVKLLASNFFRSMDTNHNNKVELSEFLQFMMHEGYLAMENAEFFRNLDLDNNGFLDFPEVMILFYIIKSGRPFCNGRCNKFIPGAFFSCIECFKAPNTPFNLCPECYRSKKFSHSHTQFLDNYILLEATRNSNIGNNTTSSKPPTPEGISTPNKGKVPAQNNNNAYTMHSSYPPPYHEYIMHPSPSPPPSVPHHTNANVVAPNKWDKCRVTLQALQAATQIAGHAAQIANLAGLACTIL